MEPKTKKQDSRKRFLWNLGSWFPERDVVQSPLVKKKKGRDLIKSPLVKEKKEGGLVKSPPWNQKPRTKIPGTVFWRILVPRVRGGDLVKSPPLFSLLEEF